MVVVSLVFLMVHILMRLGGDPETIIGETAGGERGAAVHDLECVLVLYFFWQVPHGVGQGG